MPPEPRPISADPDAENEEARYFRVTRLEEGKLTVVAKHSHVGPTLARDIEIVDNRPARSEDSGTGKPGLETSSPEQGQLRYTGGVIV